MSEFTDRAIAINKDYPYAANHELVHELIALEKKIDDLSANTDAVQYGKALELIEDMCKETDTLKDQMANLQKAVSVPVETAMPPVTEPEPSTTVPEPADQGIGQENTAAENSSSQIVD